MLATIQSKAASAVCNQSPQRACSQPVLLHRRALLGLHHPRLLLKIEKPLGRGPCLAVFASEGDDLSNPRGSVQQNAPEAADNPEERR